jgi:DNA primase
MIDVRGLLDEIRVPWRDRGKNVGHGEIVIACCFCGDDPSEHLSINEAKEVYYCYRCTRCGANLRHLVIALGVDYWEAPELLNRHNSDVKAAPPKPTKPQSSIAKAWNWFLPAAESYQCTEYLQSRGFPSPVATCRQYDLRYSPASVWAQRLLLPITEGGQLVSWVGRSLQDWVVPKYRLEPADHQVIYLPRPVRETVVIVEGSLDALKIAVATDQKPVSSLALLGKGVSAEKIQRITALIKGCRSILVAMDTDVSINDVYTIVDELAAMVDCPVNRIEVPYGHKDPGAMALDEIDGWIEQRAAQLAAREPP